MIQYTKQNTNHPDHSFKSLNRHIVVMRLFSKINSVYYSWQRNRTKMHNDMTIETMNMYEKFMDFAPNFFVQYCPPLLHNKARIK